MNQRAELQRDHRLTDGATRHQQNHILPRQLAHRDIQHRQPPLSIARHMTPPRPPIATPLSRLQRRRRRRPQLQVRLSVLLPPDGLLLRRLVPLPMVVVLGQIRRRRCRRRRRKAVVVRRQIVVEIVIVIDEIIGSGGEEGGGGGGSGGGGGWWSPGCFAGNGDCTQSGDAVVGFPTAGFCRGGEIGGGGGRLQFALICGRLQTHHGTVLERNGGFNYDRLCSGLQ